MCPDFEFNTCERRHERRISRHRPKVDETRQKNAFQVLFVCRLLFFSSASVFFVVAVVVVVDGVSCFCLLACFIRFYSPNSSAGLLVGFVSPITGRRIPRPPTFLPSVSLPHSLFSIPLSPSLWSFDLLLWRGSSTPQTVAPPFRRLLSPRTVYLPLSLFPPLPFSPLPPTHADTHTKYVPTSILLHSSIPASTIIHPIPPLSFPASRHPQYLLLALPPNPPSFPPSLPPYTRNTCNWLSKPIATQFLSALCWNHSTLFTSACAPYAKIGLSTGPGSAVRSQINACLSSPHVQI